MGEIKSTLDLVMERTRHLSLSEKEKAQQKRSEFEKRLQGLLLQYADGAMNAESLYDRIAKLQTELDIEAPQIVKNAIFDRFDPDGDNTAWLALITTYEPSAQAPLQQILTDYSDQRSEIIQAGETRQLEALLQQHGIGGSAIVPNPQKEAQCQEALSTLKQEARRKIAARCMS